jgi:Zn-dependent protease
MLLAEPSGTRFDLTFRLIGVPVRVHPLFWVVSALLGFSSRDPLFVVIWVGVVFVSILVHEFGHAVAMRRYGDSPRIVLHAMGGLTIPEPTPWGRTWAQVAPGGKERILISVAGPAAGFLLAGLVVFIMIAAGVTLGVGSAFGVVQLPASTLQSEGLRYLGVIISSLLWVNVGWGVINLLPVYPLDGGNITRQLLLMADPAGGVRKSLWVSVAVGAAVAVLGWVVLGSPWISVLFGLLAFSSYGMLRGQGIGRF